MNYAPSEILTPYKTRSLSPFTCALKLLSLDACKPFYEYLHLPRSFTVKALESIRSPLNSYHYYMSDDARFRMVYQFFINYSDQFGDTATHELAQWMLAVDFDDLNLYHSSTLLRFLSKIDSKKHRKTLDSPMPLRLERYFNFRDLTEPQGDPTEQGLLREQLRTGWDLWIFNQCADEDDSNAWYPDADVSVYADHIRSRIAWQNAFQRPPATSEEFAQLRDWIILNADGQEDASYIPDLSTLKLPERLVNEYIAQKLIV